MKLSHLIVFFLSFYLISTAISASEIQIVDGNDSPIEGLVIFLTPITSAGSDSKISPAQKSIIEIAQLNKKFKPYIKVIRKGQTVKFINKDDISHHIYSLSNSKKFAFKLKAEQMPELVKFDKTGAVSMGCNIHDWMSGHLLIVDTPYYTFTNSTGIAQFNIEKSNEYWINIWHPQLNSDNHLQRARAVFPLNQRKKIKLDKPMLEIPDQEQIDDFDFLDGY
ncbi:hypothetical protein [Aliikangiella coralliicola]|uniref:Methylamine utilization protein n=1 Tax=Aliikangiella coralliicola TaxID=2592383 RepID=A0A545UAB9_9GAMM|nr:hypothetical protein [Aliikangiella coralliicola]TQV86416.1 hypothetical protein FLL46_15975 [Aliikangiella coralliicola]